MAANKLYTVFLSSFSLVTAEINQKIYVMWVVENWLWQYLSRYHKNSSISLVFSYTCVVIRTDKNRLSESLHLPLKCFTVLHLSLLVLILCLFILKWLLKSTAELMYCSRQLLQQLGKVSKDSSCITFPVGDTACEIIRT